MTRPLLAAVYVAGLLACHKGDTNQTSRTTKTKPLITAVVFKAVDNTGLTSDISGVVLADSIKVTVPRNADVTALVPSIEFAGKSIAPTNKAPQDFTNTVVYTVTAEDGTQKAYKFLVTRQLSDEKLITGAVLRAADNTGLSTDIGGVVTTDSVKFTVPRDTDVRALVPTLSFTGKSIYPGNKTAQDFTNGVKYTITAENGTYKKYTISVAREQTAIERLLFGKWILLRDSLWDSDNFYYSDGTGYHHPTPGVYYGASTDYWEFGANGVLAVKENSLQFSKTYRLVDDAKLDIEGLTPYFDMATIDTLTANALSFYWNKTSTNGGRYYRKVYLKR